jgi:ferrous iron transport protein B
MKYALVGNPNCGKTTLFNRLTGSRGKVGNMPGVTVTSATARVRGSMHAELIDLPGTYSLHATAPDEQITQNVLLNPADANRPDVVLAVVDGAQLRSGLFLVHQVLEWGFPTLLVINQTDHSDFDSAALERGLGVPVIAVDALRGDASKFWKVVEATAPGTRRGNDVGGGAVLGWTEAVERLCTIVGIDAPRAGFMLRRSDVPAWMTEEGRKVVASGRELLKNPDGSRPSPAAMQLHEVTERMKVLRPLVPDSKEQWDRQATSRTTRVDAVLTHPVWGHIVVALVFFGLFQAVYAWAAWPMDAVDDLFSKGMHWTNGRLPDSWWRSMLIDGLLAGIAGIVVFVPQIMILFGLTAVLESTGYMARVGFLGDRFLQRIGLTGRSLVPLVSGMACAVPAVLAARSIPGKRERLLTILITPLMTCSARLPVYAFLIAFIVPDQTVAGLFNLQGLFLFAIYLVSSGAALALAAILHKSLPKRNEGGFTMEWPVYRWPQWRAVAQEMFAKGWTFVHSAGRVILVVSLVIWVLGRFGPSAEMDAARALQGTDSERNAALMEASWMGQLGTHLEPIVRPLGYDGRLGIAILTSFAAREVFVGTLSTLYPTPDSEFGSIRALQERLATEVHPATSKPLLNPASAASLIVFYMFAMQCMSTIAVVQKELNSWLWALGQAIAFSAFAYGAALLVYQVFS